MPETESGTTEAKAAPVKENNLDSAAKICAERKETMKKIMTIEGMMCGHCTGRVQKALAGVSAVTMSLEDKTAAVEMSSEVSDEVLTAAVTEAGYEVKAVS